MDRVTATYEIETAFPLRQAAETMAGEQSTGTFVRVPGETDALREAHAARVEELVELGEVAEPSLPGSGLPSNWDGKRRRARAVLSWPTANMGLSLPNLLATINGYGKRTAVDDFPVYKRGGQGVIGIQTSGRNGELVAALGVTDEDDVMLTSNAGTLVRTGAAEISRLGRNTQGVTLMRLGEDEQLIGLARIAVSDEDGDEADDEGGDDA